VALTIKDILLRITGDGDDARRELASLARDLAAFGAEEVEATASVDTLKARAELDRLEAQLNAIDGDDISVDANARVGGAMAELAALRAEISAIDGKDIDIDVHRGLIERLRALGGEVGKIGNALPDLSSGADESASSMSKLGVNIGAFSGRLSTMIPLLISAAPLVAGLVVGGAGLVSSFAEAALGAGALGIAFGASLLPVIGLAIGAMKDWQANSKTAGTAAFALRQEFGRLGKAIDFGPAVHEVFRGMADGVRSIIPLVHSLGPAFKEFGAAVGNSFRMIGREFARPEWRQFFQFLIRSATTLAPILTFTFLQFGRILAHIAQAAMPFLIRGFRALNQALRGIADGTSNIKGLRRAIAPLVGQLRSWLRLAGAVSDLMLSFFSAAAPAGQRLVNWLARGADALASWVKSKEGRQQIQEFMNRLLPVVKELVPLVLKVALAFLQFGELMAPLMTAILMGLNLIADALNVVLDWMIKVDRAGSDWGKTFGAIGHAIASAVMAIVNPLIDAFNWFNRLNSMTPSFGDNIRAAADAAIAAWGAVKSATVDLWNSVKNLLAKPINFVLHAPRDVLGAIRDIWAIAKGAIMRVINFVLHAPRAVLGAVHSIWATAKGIISSAIDFVFHAPRTVVGVARGIWGDVKGIISAAIDFVLKLPGVGGLVSAARSIWNAINDALPDITISIHIPTPHLPSLPHIPGTMAGGRDLPAGLRVLGEIGPELAFVPQGTDVFSNRETQRILRALAKGEAAGGSSNTGDRTVIEEQTIVVPPVPGTGIQDPRLTSALLAQDLRQRGQRGGK
jgi:phage-related protein